MDDFISAILHYAYGTANVVLIPIFGIALISRIVNITFGNRSNNSDLSLSKRDLPPWSEIQLGKFRRLIFDILVNTTELRRRDKYLLLLVISLMFGLLWALIHLTELVTQSPFLLSMPLLGLEIIVLCGVAALAYYVFDRVYRMFSERRFVETQFADWLLDFESLPTNTLPEYESFAAIMHTSTKPHPLTVIEWLKRIEVLELRRAHQE